MGQEGWQQGAGVHQQHQGLAVCLHCSSILPSQLPHLPLLSGWTPGCGNTQSTSAPAPCWGIPAAQPQTWFLGDVGASKQRCHGVKSGLSPPCNVCSELHQACVAPGSTEATSQHPPSANPVLRHLLEPPEPPGPKGRSLPIASPPPALQSLSCSCSGLYLALPRAISLAWQEFITGRDSHTSFLLSSLAFLPSLFPFSSPCSAPCRCSMPAAPTSHPHRGQQLRFAPATTKAWNFASCQHGAC